MEREPTRRVHQISLRVANVSEPFIKQRAAGRRFENTAVFETKHYGRSLNNRITEINADARPDI